MESLYRFQQLSDSRLIYGHRWSRISGGGKSAPWRWGTGHVWGVKIMEDIARRYQGKLQVEGRDGVFLVRTALLMPQ